MSTAHDDYVVLLHGIGREANVMQALEARLREMDYETHNETYPSTDYAIASLAHHVFLKIQHDFPDRMRRMHFVTHSMGSIIARVIVAKYRPANLGRVVMIGPPNHGSAIVDKLKQYDFLQRILGPAAIQLSAEDRGFVHQLPPIDYEVGIIAGDKSNQPWFSWMLGGKNDGKVTVESTRLEGAQDHIVIHATHLGLTSHAETIEQVEHFLERGSFSHA